MFLKMLVNQARYRWQVTVLLWLAMAALVSLYVYVNNSARYSNRSMQLIMKRMGHNLYILPETAEPIDTYLCSGEQELFPEETTELLAEHLELNSRYYTSVLQSRAGIKGRELIVTGIKPVHRNDESREKDHLTRPIQPGRIRLGARASELLGVSAGDPLELGPHKFKAAGIDEAQGTLDDYRIYMNLADAQKILMRPGRINLILAFLCMHRGDLPEVMRSQRVLTAKALPGYKTVAIRNIARARDMARRTTGGYLYYLLALVLGITVVIITVTGLQEISERRHEAGILLAMGGGYARIAVLYLSKLIVIAALAAGAGFVVGSYLSIGFLARILVTHTRALAFAWRELPESLLMTCAVALLSAILPIAKLLRLNPNEILTEE